MSAEHDPRPKEEPFFMVFVQGGNSPRHRHTTVASALMEARRIAQQQNQPTYVLQAIAAIELTVRLTEIAL